MKLLILFGLIAIAGIGFFVFQSAFLSPQAEPRDLGVVYSSEARERFLQKVGNAPSGIAAGGIPVGASFSSQEVTAFVVMLSQERNLPFQDPQVVIHDRFFEASGRITQPVSGDLYVRGTIAVKSPQEISFEFQEVESSSIQITEEFKDVLEQTMNEGVKAMVDRFAPDERFLQIQQLEFQENAFVVQGVFPQEFFPGSQIRF